MPIAMNSTDLRRYALAGAEARLLEIAREAAAIYRAFPELRDAQPVSVPTGSRRTPDIENGPRSLKRKRMSAARRKAVGERMRKYWAERRRAQGTARRGAARGAAARPGAAKAVRKGGKRGTPSADSRKRMSEAQKARRAKEQAAATA
jgi:hypothetical protein